MRKKLVYLCLFVFLSSNCYTQITISSVKKEKITVFDKPAPYDSLQNWKSYDKKSDYKRYIGLQVFFPPYNLDKDLSKRNMPIIYTKPKINPLEVKTTEKWNQDYMFDSGTTIKEIQYDFMYSIVYKPFQYNISKTNTRYKKEIYVNNSLDAKNEYYRIIDILYGEKLSELKSNWRKSISNKDYEIQKVISKHKKELYEKKESTVWDDYDTKMIVDKSTDFFSTDFNLLYVLVNETNQDTVYSYRNDKLILVPYFVKKQKSMIGNKYIMDDISYDKKIKDSVFSEDKRYEIEYEDSRGNIKNKFKKVTVHYGSKWECVDVTLTPPEYKITYIFENDNDEQITLNDNDLDYKFKRLIPYDNYKLREKNKNIKKEELAKKREQEIKNERLKNDRLKNERKTFLLNKYGEELGTLIFDGKIKIGMNKKMCEEAWGKPYDISKRITSNSKREIWFYGFGHRLYFNDDKLVEINE